MDPRVVSLVATRPDSGGSARSGRPVPHRPGDTTTRLGASIVIWVVASAAVLAGLYGLHRAALRAEHCGWIYYRNKRGRPAPWLGTLEAIYKPEVEYVIEEESASQIRAEQDESGDPPEAGPE